MRGQYSNFNMNNDSHAHESFFGRRADRRWPHVPILMKSKNSDTNSDEK